MRDLPVWIGLGTWGLTLAGGAALGLGTGLHRGAEIERHAVHPPSLADRVLETTLYGAYEPERQARLLGFLATTHPDPATRAWATNLLLASPQVATPPVPRVVDLGFTPVDEPESKVAALAEPTDAACEPTVADLYLSAQPPSCATSAGPVRVVATRSTPVVTDAIVGAPEAAPDPNPGALVGEPIEALTAQARQFAEDLADRFASGAVAAIGASAPVVAERPSATVTPGTLDTWGVVGAPEVRPVVHDHLAAWRLCFETALASTPALSGLLEVSWEVKAGDVVEVHSTLDTIGDPGLVQCVTQEVADWTFPDTVNGRVTLPAHFRAREG